jgi:hypothetical protein
LTSSLNTLRLVAAARFPAAGSARDEVHCAMAKVEVREIQTVADEEDFPAAYLLFAVVAIIVIAATAVSAFVILIR